ncbi:putative phage-like protein [Escherichia coli]|nr:putative phage-like protein [Escherichia coli]
MRAAIKTGDADTMNELVESAPASVTGDEGDLPQGVNLNINLSPQQPLPDKAPEMGEAQPATVMMTSKHY